MLRFLLMFFLVAMPAFALSQTVSGIVTDARSSDPVPGATVRVKGTTTGAFTDDNGRYSLRAAVGDTLIVSYIGYVTFEARVTTLSMDVRLVESDFSLDEVVVTGYGTSTVKDVTGSVTSVTSKDFNQGNMVSPENLLNGRAAGLTVTTGGAPGSGSTIRIRGGASLGASNDPLIVINGLPISNNTIGGARSILSTINPNDIESFTILKDASATAIFGSRASNGVILITTKNGGDKLQVQLNSQAGYSTLVNKVEVFSADDFRALVQERRPDLVGRLGTANTDWQDEIYQNVIFQSHNLSIQGALAKNFPARVSIGLTDQPGLRLTSEFQRRNAGVSLNPSFLGGHLKLSLNANYAQEKNRFAGGEEGNAITFDPTQPVYDPESPFGGFFQYYIDNGDGVLNTNDLVANSPSNPVANLLQREDRSTVDRLYGNLNLEFNLPFFEAITGYINLGLDDASSSGFVEVSEESRVAQPNGAFLGSSSEYTNDLRNMLFDGYATYKEEFDNLRVDATAGYSFQRFEGTSYFSGELKNDLPDSEPVTTTQTDLVLIGVFARANVSLSDKYLFTASFRRDATSRFAPQNRWGNFPAMAVAWRMHEDLFPGSSLVTNLKLRAGWGITGQQDIGQGAADLYLARYQQGLPSSQYAFGNQVIPIALPQFRNEELKWEETTTYNLGLDFGLFNSRLNGTVEVFYKESRDLLAFAAISDGSNFSNSGFQNIGSFSSQGLELALSYEVFNPYNRDFSWNVSFNSTIIKTKIEELALDQDVRTGGIAGGVGGTIQLHTVGYAPYKFFVYKQVYNENGAPIEGAYVDLNGDNIINDDDRYLHRNNLPEATLAFQSRMAYKSFDLNFNLRASIGNYLYNNVNSARAQYDLLQNIQVLSNLPTSVLASNFNTTPTVLLSDYYLENGSFLRLDNVNLGYTFPGKIAGKVGARFSLGAQNVFVLTNYSGLDPEIYSGIDNTIYPRARSILLGINLSY